MPAVFRSAILDAPIADVWRLLRDFNSHALWHPRIATSVIEGELPSDTPGCVRRFQLTDGAELREQLIALSDRDFSLSYCILESPIPLVDYVATLRLRPVTDRAQTLWEWRSTFRAPRGEEAALETLVGRDIYEAGFDGMRRHLAGGAGQGPVRRLRAGGTGAGAIEAEAVILREHGGPENLVLEPVRVPPPGPGEVRLHHAAIGVNYLDVYVRTGLYDILPLPGVPGVEAAGVVSEIGEGVSNILPGDRVAYACLPPGSYATARTMPSSHLVVLPDTIEEATAAAVMLKGMTAEYLLHRTHAVKAGDVVLVHAAAGGVGLLLCQWARHLGAMVIGTVSTEEKARLARDAGCEHPLIGPLDGLGARVREITGGHGADVIYDGIGRDSFAASFDALALLGHLVLYGQATGLPEPIAHGMLAGKSATVSRPVLFHYSADPQVLRAMAQNLFRMIESGNLRVSVNQRFQLGEAAAAHRALESRQTTGSSILLP